MAERRLDWRMGKLYLGDTCVGDGECAAARFMLEHNLASKRDSFVTYRGEMACFKAGVGWAAERTVRTSRSGTPVFVKYRSENARQQESEGSDDAG